MRVFAAAALMIAAGTTAAQIENSSQSGDEGTTTGLMVLNASASAAASVSGQAYVLAGKLEVASTSSNAVDVNGQGRIECNEIHLQGGYAATGQAQLMGPVWTESDAPSDPIAGRFAEGFGFDTLVSLASAGQLTTDLGTLESTNGDVVTAQPGFYSGGASISGGSVTLSPGTYIFAGSFNVTSHSQVYGHDVTIVILDGMNVAGQASFRLDAPDSGEFAGISIMMPPGHAGTISLAGGSKLVVQDTIWAPDGLLKATGHSNSMLEGPILGSTVIVDSLAASGRGVILLGYADSANMKASPQWD